MKKQTWLTQAQRFTVRNWNAILGGSSLAGVAIFSAIPPLQKFVGLFIFLAANAVVWTVVELKIQLGKQESTEQVHNNMMSARPHIVAEIEGHLRRTSVDKPLRLTLIGGRMRSMSDVVREVANDLARARITGWLVVDAYCIDPYYLAQRVLAGGLSPDTQRRRNRAIGQLVDSVREELTALSRDYGSAGGISVSVTPYRHDPYLYAYLIGNSTLFWGPFTWSPEASDLLGPENPCIVVDHANPQFDVLREWIESRTRLLSAEYSQPTSASHPPLHPNP